ncbi:MAG: response regulator [Candidatus Magnetomorum sp.]|nr:response regulator [Candidatus Magnetomorum sp.]
MSIIDPMNHELQKIKKSRNDLWKNNAVGLFFIVLLSSLIPMIIVICSSAFLEWGLAIAGVVSVLFSAFIAYAIVYQTSNSLYELNQWIHEVIAGHLEIKHLSASNAPVWSLMLTFQLLVRHLINIRDTCDAISLGDYSKSLTAKPLKGSIESAVNVLRKKFLNAGVMAERHLNFLNNVPMPIIIMNRKLEIEYINLAAEKIFQQPVSKCLGIKCKNLLKSDQCTEGDCKAFRAIQTDMTLTTVTTMHINSGSLPVRYINVPIHDNMDTVVGVMKFIMDISNEMNLLNMAETISKGDYSVEIKAISQDDRLSSALNLMTQTLREVTEENKRQNWIKTGQTELNVRLRGEQDLHSLVENVIFFLCDYIKSPIGIMYIEKETKLKQIASYAHTKRKSFKNEFDMGEGLVGQAALEKKTILLTGVPPTYMNIQSGLGEERPGSVIVVPLLFHDKLLGLMELGALKAFSQVQIDFLEMIAENIAVAINTAKARTRMSTLLAHSQNQSEELKVQQEELRQAYEDLEEQTKRIKESEANLQQQHEELSQSNKALEQQTQLLEQQKDAVRKKNDALEQQQTLIQEKARDLEIANRYKSEFLANMSHELRTPLNSILLLSGIISENKENNLTDKQVEFANTINMCGTDLLNLINEVLDLSKVESGKMDLYPEFVYIQDMVSSIEKTFQPLADQKQVKFTITVDPSLPEQIFTDQLRLEQILKNLLSNAFKFTSKGQVSFLIKRPEACHISDDSHTLQSSQMLLFEVTDTGIGISKDKHKLIFEAFHQGDGTTKRRYGGTGLGLSIVKKIITLMGGEIHLTSGVGKGSTFWVVLPESLSSDMTPSVVNDIQPDKPVREKNIIKKELQTPSSDVSISPTEVLTNIAQKTVLIVSDIDMIASHLENIVAQQGFLPHCVYSAQEAYEYCLGTVPNGIILDLALPDWTCWFLYLNLQQNKKLAHIPLHWVSGLHFQSPENQERMFFLKQDGDISVLKSVLATMNAHHNITIKTIVLICSKDSLIKNLFENDSDITGVFQENILEAKCYLDEHPLDAIILDTSFTLVQDISSIADLSQKVKELKVPVIFLTDADIWDQEWIFPLVNQNGEFQKKSFNVIERMTDETLLYFHRLKKNDVNDKDQNVLVHDKDAILKGKKLLLVDDDMRNVFAVSSVLEARGLTVIVGRNGKEGLNCLEEHSNIDLVLMDIMMPEMDGYEAIAHIRKQQRYQKLPIIALTAKAMKKDREKCIEVGADDYMPKPVYPDKLISMLRLWLNK